nr:MAG TPA: hypothetical protein [Caudoviricetes sp.]
MSCPALAEAVGFFLPLMTRIAEKETKRRARFLAMNRDFSLLSQ